MKAEMSTRSDALNLREKVLRKNKKSFKVFKRNEEKMHEKDLLLAKLSVITEKVIDQISTLSKSVAALL